MNKALIEDLKKLIVQAGEIAIANKNVGLKIELKSDKSPVTNADKEISNLIYRKLNELTPDIPVICEEQPITNINSSIFWLIDPIDGTRSYIGRASSYTVNISLIENNIPVCGFIYQPEMARLYYTDSDSKLVIEEGGKILVTKCSATSSNFVATVSSHYLNMATRYFLKQHSITEIIRMPSSIKLCMIAEGAADIYPRFGRTMEWDVAAGHALIRAAGGDIVDEHGKTLTYGKPDFENPTVFAFSENWKMEHALSSNILDPNLQD